MASNFAFLPYGLSSRATIGSTPSTISFAVVGLGSITATVAGANRYQPPGVRLVNSGTASLFVQFGPAPASTVTVCTSTGLEMLPNSVEVFSVRGHQFLAAVCASTFTVTLGMTYGEGM